MSDPRKKSGHLHSNNIFSLKEINSSMLRTIFTIVLNASSVTKNHVHYLDYWRKKAQWNHNMYACVVRSINCAYDMQPCILYKIPIHIVRMHLITVLCDSGGVGYDLSTKWIWIMTRKCHETKKFNWFVQRGKKMILSKLMEVWSKNVRIGLIFIFVSFVAFICTSKWQIRVLCTSRSWWQPKCVLFSHNCKMKKEKKEGEIERKNKQWNGMEIVMREKNPLFVVYIWNIGVCCCISLNNFCCFCCYIASDKEYVWWKPSKRQKCHRNALMKQTHSHKLIHKNSK